MAMEFKPVRFFVMMAVAAFIVCGVTAFYTHRAEHGRTAEERQAYWIGEKAEEQAQRDAKMPTAVAALSPDLRRLMKLMLQNLCKSA